MAQQQHRRNGFSLESGACHIICQTRRRGVVWPPARMAAATAAGSGSRVFIDDVTVEMNRTLYFLITVGD